MIRIIIFFLIVTICLTIDIFPNRGGAGDVAHLFSKNILLVGVVFLLYVFGKVYSYELYKFNVSSLYNKIFEHLILPGICIFMIGQLFSSDAYNIFIYLTFYFLGFFILCDINHKVRDYMHAREKRINDDVIKQAEGSHIFTYGVLFYFLALFLFI